MGAPGFVRLYRLRALFPGPVGRPGLRLRRIQAVDRHDYVRYPFYNGPGQAAAYTPEAAHPPQRYTGHAEDDGGPGVDPVVPTVLGVLCAGGIAGRGVYGVRLPAARLRYILRGLYGAAQILRRLVPH